MKSRSLNRRHPFVIFALIVLALVLTGGTYAIASKSNEAQAAAATSDEISEGQKLFAANCATCHGLNAQGTKSGPSLIGVGAAAVDFQVGTGRMPMQMQGPQAQRKPAQFDEKQTGQLAAYVASLGAGPSIPDAKTLDTSKLTPEQIAEGGEIFRANCAMCHSAAAAGGALTRGKFAPTLEGVSEKHIYEAMATGPQNMPVFSDSNLSPESKTKLIAFLKTSEAQGSPGGAKLGSLGPVAEGLFMWTAVLGVIIGFTIWLTSRSH